MPERQPAATIPESAGVARAEFYLCLARAFLPPMEERDFHAFKEQLAPTLEQLGGVLDYPIGPLLGEFRAALDRIAGKQDLLQLYSRLFLVPPALAHLNAGLYLDGAVMGQNTVEIEAHYRHAGLVRSPDFHDTPDHLSLLLEFLAYLCIQAEEKRAADDKTLAGSWFDQASDFARDYIARWLPALRHDLGSVVEHGSNDVYAALAEILLTAMMHDFKPLSSAFSSPSSRDTCLDEAARDVADQIHCRECGMAFIATEEMHDILLALGRSGLDTEHLELCPDCRMLLTGLSKMPVPDPKRLRH
jgi:putative dimethyl sulfoxide reductase chaperone